MASARLRQAFRYPDDGDEHPELDEEQQEQLIADLQQHDATNSHIYRIGFTAIPAIAAIFFLVSLLTASTTEERLDAVLGLSSLASSTYLFIRIPPEPDRKGKKPLYLVEREKSPTDQYLLYLNVALVAVLALKGLLSWMQGLSYEALKEGLPAVIFGLLQIAKHQLRPLEWQELQQARYELKGA